MARIVQIRLFGTREWSFAVPTELSQQRGRVPSRATAQRPQELRSTVRVHPEPSRLLRKTRFENVGAARKSLLEQRWSQIVRARSSRTHPYVLPSAAETR